MSLSTSGQSPSLAFRLTQQPRMAASASVVTVAPTAQRMQVRNDNRRRRKQQQPDDSNGDSDAAAAATEEKPRELASCLGNCLNAHAEAGDVEQVRSLLESNVPHSSDWLGFTALHLAARNGHLDVCRCLLWYNFAAEARNKVARTPLHLAAAAGHYYVVSLLLDSGANPNCEDFLRNRPLHCACQGNWPAIVDLLLRSGAHPTVLNKFGQSARQVAASLGHTECASLLSGYPDDAMVTESLAPVEVDVVVCSSDDGSRGVCDIPGEDLEVSLSAECQWPAINEEIATIGDAGGIDDLGLLSDLGQLDCCGIAVGDDLDAHFQSGEPPPPSPTIGLDLRLRLQELADRATSDQLRVELPADCVMAQVPAYLGSLGIRVTARHGASLLGWFLATDGSAVNLRAQHEADSGSLVVSAFRVDCQLLEHLQSGCES